MNHKAKLQLRTGLAHEYQDHPEVLGHKISVWADLIRRAKATVGYTAASVTTPPETFHVCYRSREHMRRTSWKTSPRTKSFWPNKDD